MTPTAWTSNNETGTATKTFDLVKIDYKDNISSVSSQDVESVDVIILGMDPEILANAEGSERTSRHFVELVNSTILHLVTIRDSRPKAKPLKLIWHGTYLLTPRCQLAQDGIYVHEMVECVTLTSRRFE